MEHLLNSPKFSLPNARMERFRQYFPPPYNCAIRYTTVAFGIGTPQFGRGGGLSVFFKGRATGNKVTISNSEFVNNNAIWGGGFLSDFLDYSTDNELTINNSSFIDNKCDYDHDVYAIGTGGGGVRVALHFYNNTLNRCTNHIKIVQCYFRNNTAYYGGGVSFSTVKQSHMCNQSHGTISFQQCSWVNNTARTSSGVDLNVHTLPEGHVDPAYFRDCSFIGNTNKYVLDRPIYQLGIGSLYSDAVPIDFDGRCVFRYNSDGALAATASRLTFSQNSSLLFENNTGHHGGAIALLGNAYMLVEKNTSLVFCGNSVDAKGGAIYSLAPSQRDFVSTKKCFVYYEDLSESPYNWNTSFIFTDNHALTGNSIFVTTLLPYIWDIQTNVNHSLINEVLYWKGTFDYGNSNRTLEISTEPLNVDKEFGTDVVILPGELFDLDSNPTDDKKDNTTAIFLVETDSINVSVGGSSNYTSDKGAVQLSGPPHTKFDLRLQTVGVRPLLFTIQAELGECPPGYYIDYSSGNVDKAVCKCSIYSGNNSYHGIAHCNDQDNYLVAYLRPQIWAGYEHINGNKVLFTGDCPDNYCFVNDTVHSKFLTTLPSSTSADSLNKLLCEQKKRTGRLCGMCMEHHYVYINSPTYDCGTCNNVLSKNGFLLIVLLKYIPMTIFLCIIVFFDISLLKGPLNAFVFFSQILPAADVYAGGATEPENSGPENFFIKSYQFLYGIWNLNFIETLIDNFCTFKYRSALSVLLLEYISASCPFILFLFFVYALPWVLTKLKMSRINCIHDSVVSLQSRCTRFRKKLSPQKSSIIHGLTTFLVLSYVKLTSVTWHILSSVVVYGPGGKDSDIYKTVAWVDGTKPYFGEVHGKYAAVAFVILCFVVLAPLLLLSHIYLPKLFDEKGIVHKLLLNPLNHGKPFFDAIQSCFKDEYQCFAAFYFVYRIIAWAIFSFSPTVPVHYMLQLGFYTTILFLHSWCQPYKKSCHNVVDLFIFSLLILINTISFYRFSEFDSDLSPSPITFWFQLFLIYCPLFYVVVYTLLKHCSKWCHPWLVRQLSRKDQYQMVNQQCNEDPARLQDDRECAEL